MGNEGGKKTFNLDLEGKQAYGYAHLPHGGKIEKDRIL